MIRLATIVGLGLFAILVGAGCKNLKEIDISLTGRGELGKGDAVSRCRHTSMQSVLEGVLFGGLAEAVLLRRRYVVMKGAARARRPAR